MNKGSIALFVILCCSLLAFAGGPYTTPVIDGNMADWWEAEMLEDASEHNPWGDSNLKGLWVTWDAENLYIGMSGEIDGNKLTTYLCVDPATGLQDFTDNYEWQGANMIITGNFGADFTFETEGMGYHQIWAYNEVDDTFDEITEDGSTWWDGSGGERTGYEASIPWSELFPGAAQTVPENLTIRLITLLRNNVGSGHFASDDIIPASNRNNGVYDGGSGAWTDVPDFIEITVDSTGDGIPDDDGSGNPLTIIDVTSGGDLIEAVFNSDVGSGGNVAANYNLYEVVVDDDNIDLGAPDSASVNSETVTLTWDSDVIEAGTTYLLTFENIEMAGNGDTFSGAYQFTGGIAQAVTVIFNLDASDIFGGDAPYTVRGSIAPLTWGDDTVVMNDVGGAQFRAEATFPFGTSPELEYKYANNVDWEDFAGNRTLTLDDSVEEMQVFDRWSVLGDPLTQPIDVQFELDMQNFLVGTLHIRGDVSPLTWGDDSIELTHLSGTIYGATVTFPDGSSSIFEYKFTNTIPGMNDDEPWWDPEWVNLVYTISEVEDNIIEREWQNFNVPTDEIPTSVDGIIWTLMH